MKLIRCRESSDQWFRYKTSFFEFPVRRSCVGADDSIEWAHSGKFDFGILINNIEDAFNEYLESHIPDANGINVPIKLEANAGEAILLNGVQLYLDNIPGDFEPDGDVDWIDLGKFTSHWLHAHCNDPNWCEGCDIGGDGSVNFTDFAELTKQWLYGIMQ